MSVLGSQGYPDGNPKTAIGSSKPPLHFVPPIAFFHLGQAMQNGGEKYGPFNWRESEVSASVYYDAMMRHIAEWWDCGDKASDSGIHHFGHAMACMAIVLDAESIGKLNDDRPAIKGATAKFINEVFEKNKGK